MRLWLQYAGIALVAIAYLGGMIGWTYASMKMDKEAAAVHREVPLQVEGRAPATPPIPAKTGAYITVPGREG